MSKHTPGPWALTEGDRFEIESDDGWSISMSDGRLAIHNINYAKDVYSEDPEWIEAQANARLISAAPDLLEALECVLYDLNVAGRLRGEYDLNKARAAIAKAKGESQ